MSNETVTYDTDPRSRDKVEFAGYSVSGSKLPKIRDVSSIRGAKARDIALAVQDPIKRILDILGAGMGLLLLFPLFVAIAVAIKLTSRGPVFFRQQRYGLDNVPFTVFKFRTMHQHLCDATGIAQTVADDPRVTFVGNFLRRSNFDELPQLFNVLRGDMSLVGPRPHVPGMLAAGVPYEHFDRRYLDRHKVRPGITGLAQVNGFRGETRSSHAARMRLEYDLTYIGKQSVLLDLKIIGVTVVREFFSGNGY